MAFNSKMIQRLTKASTSDMQHTSSYAKAQNAGHFGAEGGQTFAERQAIEWQRKMVQGYKNARVAQGVNRIPRARTYAEELEIRKKALENRHSAREKDEIDGCESRYQRFGNNAQPEQMTARQQMAARFAAPARPAPKTGGFGRH